MSSPRPPRPAAPEPLRLIQQFVNTLDRDPDPGQAPEAFTSPPALRDWLVDRGLMEPGAPLDAAGLARALAVREGLRGLLRVNAGAPPDPTSLAALNQAAERATLRPRFDSGGGAALEPGASGIDRALGRLLALVVGATVDGSWSRLKACRDESCLFIFYDQSRNRSSSWCRMDECGNRAKARRYRQRHAAPPPGQGAMDTARAPSP